MVLIRRVSNFLGKLGSISACVIMSTILLKVTPDLFRILAFLSSLAFLLDVSLFVNGRSVISFTNSSSPL